MKQQGHHRLPVIFAVIWERYTRQLKSGGEEVHGAHHLRRAREGGDDSGPVCESRLADPTFPGGPFPYVPIA
eukprot:CAMPEP_0181198704 /NCGR_PEP_ID=MMETSP1096-20121128/16770_1 /TAXON_ID=156174 ORGANISM="Chrysochromulina ericina, Strain CCMP281" /NCGR_SAMPLE_ID=MMETSP1096 /ASSEMBLY_ACC=CAM_ASM_000453 /LENGTH=71 /DNA_ID=CAMNT_0023288807 /DNA_START=735 /DNA_END=950 /DNA_ORIENTATION=-